VVFFRNYFDDTDFEQVNSSGEVSVRCPFPHHANGVEYFEENPSAHINEDKGVFHCKVCGAKHSEASFIKQALGVSYGAALRLLKHLENYSISASWYSAISNLDEELVGKLHISKSAAIQLRLGTETQGIGFPVYVYGQLMDIRTYNPGGKPKVKSRFGASAGYFLPDVAKMRDINKVLICAGEKDMAIARTFGFDAFTITGGEMATPTHFGYAFKNKNVYIIYDNDEAGVTGAKKLGRFVYDNGGTPHLVFGHHTVAKEKGEDLYDYLVKYHKTKEDLETLLNETPPMSNEDYQTERDKEYPRVSLDEAPKPELRGRYITSTIQVTGVYNNPFGIPNVLEVEKVELPPETRPMYNQMAVGKFIYTIDDTNIDDILYLMDSGLKEEQVNKNIKNLVKIPAKEKGVFIRPLSYATVYKCTVSTHLVSENSKPVEMDMYSFTPLENGKKYHIIFKTVQHPLRQQELILIAKEVIPIENDLEDFRVTEEVKERLAKFKQKPNETVTEAMDRLFELDKGYIGAEASKDIVQTVDLVYNTPLQVKVGKQSMRGALDVFMVGETRTGKSKTSKIKRELYGLGSVINLGTTTVQGLIGGTNKATNRTKIGLLPREHKSLVVLEEFSSMNDNAFIKAMTDIRSSNEVRIVRVDSDIRVPCKLRMLTISNPKSRQGGAGKSMKSYPNGIEIILELIDSPEDIARYDFFVVVPEPEKYASFLDIEYEKLPVENYRDRVRWIWTRKDTDISMTPQVQLHLWKVSEELNRTYNTHIRLFGTEAWMKLARIAIGAAGMLVSTDDYNKIVVTKEHIDWAKDFLVRMYDNEVFKLKQFVYEQRKYTEVDSVLIQELQDLYYGNATMLSFLEMSSGVSRATLRDVSGLSNEEFSIVLNNMARLYLFKWSGSNLIPSERFRKGLSQINRTLKVERKDINVV
jgi:5S rRNA maturation endonuclease (ribonuclease M5)